MISYVYTSDEAKEIIDMNNEIIHENLEILKTLETDIAKQAVIEANLYLHEENAELKKMTQILSGIFE